MLRKKSVGSARQKSSKIHMGDDVGGGLKNLWMLPIDHRFQSAFINHDAMHEAMDVYNRYGASGYYIIDSLQNIHYRTLVRLQLDILIHKRELGIKSTIQSIAKDADWVFYMACLKLSKSTFDIMQAKLFYRIVRIYSLFKYKDR